LQNRTRTLVLISLTVALTAAGAYIKIPMVPAPVTLQTFLVLLAGAVLGPAAGAAAMAAYILVGLVGIPVFAGGGGPQYVLMPTFGFLLSFPLAAFAIGAILPPGLERPSFKRSLAAMAAGTVIIYLVGFPWLWLNLKLVQGKDVSLLGLSKVALLPFLPGDLLKLIVASRLVAPLKLALSRP
jgi:biotin transport system substrate-specific component